jgi:NADH:ubiquinone oxidoreductase subunit 2 (subunit N)
MLMASAYDLLSLFVGLETLSISTYALCGFLRKTSGATRARSSTS